MTTSIHEIDSEWQHPHEWGEWNIRYACGHSRACVRELGLAQHAKLRGVTFERDTACNPCAIAKRKDPSFTTGASDDTSTAV